MSRKLNNIQYKVLNNDATITSVDNVNVNFINSTSSTLNSTLVYDQTTSGTGLLVVNGTEFDASGVTTTAGIELSLNKNTTGEKVLAIYETGTPSLPSLSFGIYPTYNKIKTLLSTTDVSNNFVVVGNDIILSNATYDLVKITNRGPVFYDYLEYLSGVQPEGGFFVVGGAGTSWITFRAGINISSAAYGTVIMGYLRSTNKCHVAAHNASQTAWGTLYMGVNSSSVTNQGSDLHTTTVLPMAAGNTAGQNSSLSYKEVWGNSLVAPSDATLKELITDSDLGLTFIEQLRPVKYKLKDTYVGEKLITSHARKHYGFIAQEVRQVIENLGIDINTIRFYDEPALTGEEGTISLNYVELIPILINAIKELKTKISSLNQRIIALKAL